MTTDIAKCTGDLDGEICPLRLECHRYVLHPDPYRQTYMLPNAIGEACEEFWPEQERKEREQ